MIGKKSYHYLSVKQFSPFGYDVELDPFQGPRQHCTSNDQDGQHQVGEGGSEVGYLPSRSDALYGGQEHHDPRKEEAGK